MEAVSVPLPLLPAEPHPDVHLALEVALVPRDVELEQLLQLAPTDTVTAVLVAPPERRWGREVKRDPADRLPFDDARDLQLARVLEARHL